MNFKTMMLTAAGHATGRNKNLSSKMAGVKSPFLWKSLENAVKHRYFEETGIKIGAGFDWSTILEWVIEALPILLKVILIIFAL